ncbi:MAG: DUF4440 domain-containing protein [Spirosomataceae bacterium]
MATQSTLMHRLGILLFCLACWLPSSSLQAQGSCPQVKLVFDQLMTQLVDPTEVGLQDLTHPKLSYGHSNGRIENQMDFIQALVSGKSDFKSISSSSFLCEGTAQTAFIRQDLTANIQDGGIDQTIHLHVLYVFTLEQKTWKLIARQAVKRNPS